MKWLAASGLALLVGCASMTTPAGPDADHNQVPGPHRPDAVLVLGAIAGFNHDDPRITLVHQGGRTVLVRVTTYGGGCHALGPTEVSVDGMVALLTPYDYTAPPGTPCTLPLLSFRHEATITFPASGAARVRVRGIDASTRHAANLVGDTIVVERTILLP